MADITESVDLERYEYRAIVHYKRGRIGAGQPLVVSITGDTFLDWTLVDRLRNWDAVEKVVIQCRRKPAPPPEWEETNL